MKCTRHMSGRYEEGDCPICRLTVEINEVFGGRPDFGMNPRYRFWRIKRSPGKSERTFEYTTETADARKYWAVERRWVRTKGGERGRIVRKVGFKTRKKAKARAYEWYTKAQPPAPVTV